MDVTDPRLLLTQTLLCCLSLRHLVDSRYSISIIFAIHEFTHHFAPHYAARLLLISSWRSLNDFLAGVVPFILLVERYACGNFAQPLAQFTNNWAVETRFGICRRRPDRMSERGRWIMVDGKVTARQTNDGPVSLEFC